MPDVSVPDAAQALLTCCRECRDEAPPFATDITPADFIIWGKLTPPEGLGPKCHDHAVKYLGHDVAARSEQYAVVDLRPLRAALAAAPPTPTLVDGIPEDLRSDIESEIHQHLGAGGQSDETNDWVTDLMSAITPLIARVLAAAPPDDEPAKLREENAQLRQALQDSAVRFGREKVARFELAGKLRDLRAAAGSPPPTPDDPISEGGDRGR